MKWPFKLPSSLFFRLVLLTLFAIIGAYFIVFISFRWFIRSSDLSKKPFLKHGRHYIQLVIEKVEPLSLQEAKSYLANYDVDFWRQRQGNWEGTQTLPFGMKPQDLIDRAEIKAWGIAAGDIGLRRGYLVFPSQSSTYIFFSKHAKAPDQINLPPVIFLLTGISSILIALLLSIRVLLKPIRSLNVDMERFSKAPKAEPLHNKVLGQGISQEFRDLYQSFHIMKQRITEMIELRERMLTDVSHELRSPITRIRVATSLLPSSHIIDQINDDIADMDHLIGAILDNARLQQEGAEFLLSKEEIAMRHLFEDQKKLLDSSKVLRNELDQTLTVHGDKTLLKLLVKNLYHNKNQHAPDAKLTVHSTSDDEQVTILVEDDGPGVSSEELSRLVKPFYRPDLSRKRASGGFGLGLSLCQRIAEAHGGTLMIRQRQPHGLIIELKLPLKQQPKPNS
ncbi:MAG: HAMP domain-containing histidine kinase [Pseudobacteriovorax sp.]|nr:HAMP domain-containing histidine kinase [Pseudobacteriovorax sp.]